ncbi:Uncharacterised protein [Vibrio cholerae]|nr:Uncharacterised protein [Vibrio cholerae]
MNSIPPRLRRSIWLRFGIESTPIRTQNLSKDTRVYWNKNSISNAKGSSTA